MIPLRCTYCNKAIQTMWSPQVWKGGEPFCPGCYSKHQTFARWNTPAELEAKVFTSQGFQFLRCPTCQSAALLSLEYNHGRCRCGQMLVPAPRLIDNDGVPDVMSHQRGEKKTFVHISGIVCDLKEHLKEGTKFKYVKVPNNPGIEGQEREISVVACRYYTLCNGTLLEHDCDDVIIEILKA